MGDVPVPAGYRVGEWEIGGFLAAGSWGSVYLARLAGPEDGGEPVEAAVKFMSTAGLAPRQARELAETARREVEFSHATDHPYLIRLLDTAVVSDPGLPALDGAVALVMERASRSLLDVLSGSSGADANAAGQAVLGGLLLQVAEALTYLHEAGWVHGDLKPGNILLMADGTARLADFGLVSQMEGTHGYAPPLGSPDYLPPERRTEQLGERGVITRPATDIWAFGVTTHQMLTGGTFPFPGSTPASRAAAVHEYAAGRSRLRLASDLAPAWQEIVTACLAADPETRAATTMRALLPRIRAAGEATAPVRLRPRRRMAVAAVAAATVSAAVLGPAVFGWPWQGDPGRPAGVEIHVFNIDGKCKEQTERLRACSLGLARDPHRKYDADNVVSQRVWHGDVLRTDCVVNDGDRVEDELGIGTPRWYRIRFDSTPDGRAWLPAVRTRDDPKVPVCTDASSP
ncbi:serine/threonine-protein kinase [Streptomyces sp. NPDC091273]|uniref:serine/threonine-protein kinase n=1 Tax=Streptomyces sp. NPDC091273 TaxID=3365982 RepID=UPI0037F9A9B9